MPDDGLIYLSREPINAETPLDRQTGIVTPAASHYIRSHFPIPGPPVSLTVDGAVRDVLRLSHQDIVALPARSLTVTLECAGNGRAFLDPPAPGEQWRTGAVGTAEWTGVPLREVLALSAPRPSAVEVLFVGADEGVPKDLGTRIAFERSLPVSDALGGDALIAYAMNGAPIPPEHGAPWRLIVPGWYGVASVKWLARIRVLERAFEGFYQTDRYVIDRRPLREIAPRAVITSPSDGARVTVAGLAVRGYAWSGRGDIARVELSIDGGRTWREMDLSKPVSRYAWQEWRSTVEPAGPGEIVLMARAVTVDGARQPREEQRNALGYANNAIRPVRVTVAA